MPRFPYAELVRYPLLAVSFIATCILHELIFPLNYETAMLLAMFTLTTLGFASLLQLWAVPRGLFVMSTTGTLNSCMHWLAITCGCSLLGLLAFFFVREPTFLFPY